MSESPGNCTEETRDQQREMILQQLGSLREAVEAIQEAERNRQDTIADLAVILPTLKDMAEAWKSAAWFGKFVKWLAKLVAAIGVLVAAWRFGISGKGG